MKPNPPLRVSFDQRAVFPVCRLAVWAALVLGGFGYLLHYTTTTGVGDRGVVAWPRDAQIVRQAGRATFVVFMHPACPCSRATVNELARLLARAGTTVDTVAAFIRPAAFKDGWERTPLWESASRIPGIRCVADIEGREARRFGAATSGYTLLYDANGRLVFRGGITAARGHEGDSAGKNSVLAWLRDGRLELRETPVFGCPLFDE